MHDRRLPSGLGALASRRMGEEHQVLREVASSCGTGQRVELLHQHIEDIQL